MANPFTFHKNATTPAEHQANANYYTYERMAACDALAEYDNARVRAPADVISLAHTAKWVEKEFIRIARNARAAARA